MVSQSSHPHFVLFPFMAQGHLIPMVDIARLLAQRDVIITVFTTTRNASRVESVLSRAVSSGLQIRLVQLQFPCKEAGLPEGIENCDMLSSMDMFSCFFNAISLLQKQAEPFFEALVPPPNCIISDMCIPWTAQIAEKYQIPRLSFHGFSCFSLHCLFKIRSSKAVESITSDSEYFYVPGIPDQVRITKAQLPGKGEGNLQDFMKQINNGEMKSYGAVINTFEELEEAYVKDYKKERKDKVWCLGPVSLCNKDDLDKAQRGNKASINEHQCLKWLDLQQPKSVVYVCMGSLCNLNTSQLIELALALEESNKSFIWAIRGWSTLEELEKWIKEDGFQERIKGRGLLIRGWAPQVLILSHPAIGGFLTHCGWNSTVEGISSGLPLVTWPLFADQFLNEKLAQLLRIGVSVGAEIPVRFGEEGKTAVYVKKEDIRKAICKLMDEGEESEQRRKRASKLGAMAKRAVEEGGSSHRNINSLVQDIMQNANKETKVSSHVYHF